MDQEMKTSIASICREAEAIREEKGYQTLSYREVEQALLTRFPDSFGNQINAEAKRVVQECLDASRKQTVIKQLVIPEWMAKRFMEGMNIGNLTAIYLSEIAYSILAQRCLNAGIDTIARKRRTV